MDQHVRERLQGVCSLVERRFTGAMCAFEGFARERMPAEDEDAVIEVFFAPVGSLREIARATHDELRAIWKAFGFSVAVVAHYPDDTLRYYADDVLTLWPLRGLASILDPSGFGESTSGDARFSVETISVSSNAHACSAGGSPRFPAAFASHEADAAPWCEESAAEPCYA